MNFSLSTTCRWGGIAGARGDLGHSKKLLRVVKNAAVESGNKRVKEQQN